MTTTGFILLCSREYQQSTGEISSDVLSYLESFEYNQSILSEIDSAGFAVLVTM